MESKNKFWKGVLVGVLVTAFAGLIVVGGAAGIFLIGRSVMENQAQVQSLAEGTEDGEVSAVDWNQVEMKSKRIQAIIESYFLFDKDNQRMEEYIYKGLMAGLDDPYSVYYTSEEFEELMEDTTGGILRYRGIGIQKHNYGRCVDFQSV